MAPFTMEKVKADMRWGEVKTKALFAVPFT